ncbi:hypothetical protein MRB53_032872 [Persea americana]|uniref:Uncharacterized protein n=1 Tax=Persea americana TaxID=3435 RepID=A0ACC2KT41_PERAE|nr:hypothetical protein MRB53_032872 [Persea americana]
MLRACVLEFGKDWQKSLPLCEFAYNNSYHSSIGMAPLEALYGHRCRTPICWEEIGVGSFHGPSIVSDTNPSHVLQYEPLELQPNVTYVEPPSRIIDTKEQVLRTWRNWGFSDLSVTWRLASLQKAANRQNTDFSTVVEVRLPRGYNSANHHVSRRLTAVQPNLTVSFLECNMVLGSRFGYSAVTSRLAAKATNS